MTEKELIVTTAKDLAAKLIEKGVGPTPEAAAKNLEVLIKRVSDIVRNLSP